MINWNWLLVLPYFLMASAHALSVAFWWKGGVCYYEWALLSVACVALPAQIRSLEALSTLTAASVGAIGVVLVLTAASLILEGREVDGEPSVWLPPPDMSVWDCFDSVSMMTLNPCRANPFLHCDCLQPGRELVRAQVPPLPPPPTTTTTPTLSLAAEQLVRPGGPVRTRCVNATRGL